MRESFLNERAQPSIERLKARPLMVRAYANKALELAGVRVLLDSSHPDLLDAVESAARFRAAAWTMVHESTSLTVNGQSIELPFAPGYGTVPIWEQSWGLAWALRSRALIEALLRSNFEATPPDPGVLRGPSTPLWMQVLPELERGGDDWLDVAERGADLTSESAVDADTWPHVRRIHHGFRAITALERPRDFNKELLAFVVAHDEELVFKERGHDHAAAIAWLPLGLAAKAQDRGIEVTVESDYLPPVLLHPTT